MLVKQLDIRNVMIFSDVGYFSIRCRLLFVLEIFILVVAGFGFYLISFISQKNRKKRGKSYQINEEISRQKAHTNTEKLN